MPARGPREPLSRSRILRAAIALADEEGLVAVTMRSLATRLGVVPMALYKHVADKDDLRAGMIDLLVEAYQVPATGTWREAVIARIGAAREAVLTHPWLRAAIEAAPAPTPTTLGHLEAIASAFASAGMSDDLIHHGMHALGPRVWGYAPEAFTAPPTAEPPAPEQVAAFAARFPHIAAIAYDTAMRHPAGACDERFEFDFTLDLLLDAITRLHETGWQSRPLHDPTVTSGSS